MVTNNSLIIMPILNLFLSTRKRGMVGKFKDLFKEEKVEMFYARFTFFSLLSRQYSRQFSECFLLSQIILCFVLMQNLLFHDLYCSISNWAVKFGEELWELAETMTKANQIQQVAKDDIESNYFS